MKNVRLKANNYWRTFRQIGKKPQSRKVIWLAFKLALLLVRMICKLIDLFDGGFGDG